MVTFKCNACGNLHGARVENCGMCGSADVTPLAPDAPPPAPGDSGPAVDATAAALGPLFERAFDYVRERDARREERLAQLDANEEHRRENIAEGIIQLCGALTDLAHAGAAFFRQSTPTEREPSSPRVD